MVIVQDNCLAIRRQGILSKLHFLILPSLIKLTLFFISFLLTSISLRNKLSLILLIRSFNINLPLIKLQRKKWRNYKGRNIPLNHIFTQTKLSQEALCIRIASVTEEKIIFLVFSESKLQNRQNTWKCWTICFLNQVERALSSKCLTFYHDCFDMMLKIR